MRQADATRRQIDVDGTFNVRDLGGLRTRRGDIVRPGLLYRAGDLGRLTPEGARRLRDLGVVSVLDLRTTAEVERHGRFPFERYGIAHLHVPLRESRSVEPEAVPPDVPPDVLLSISQQIADEGAAPIVRVLTLLAGEQPLPAVLHCVAGKDRTGVVVGLLLALLEVPDQDIADDYALSEAGLAQLGRWAEQDAWTAAWFARIPKPVLEAKPATMLTFLEWVRERHGSVEGFAGGAGAGVVEGLRTRLLQAGAPGP
jgi:protein-tyrosine phosphatase